ncbi:hypothetical protein [Pseudoalteromonas obscura]|uniref:Fibronectin type-III domain-containing protein n=1 Tax=Pseudoalteromonas obscura TaxID=3048491 RepID=A0ABT7ENT7_9GAMM|nr:hypothetical protein [Pseudoalteromonas sp. P94(2023)]MDK2596678.1 hypothetical protein [Pseudoalteromonas sp. P94(2023)]
MKLLKSVLLFLILSQSWNSSASTITLTNAKTSPNYLSGDVDKFIVTEPNSHGISYNRLKNFNITRPLLMLDHNSLPGITPKNQLKTVVIHADTISLNSALSFVSGDISANIIFIVSSANGAISCTSCSFNGYPRITLAASTNSTGLSSSMSSVGNLTNTSGGQVSLNNLSAPDAVSIETHAKTISTAGNIHSVFRAQKQGTNHVVSDSGLIGVNGGFSFFTGPLTVNYNNHEVVDADETVSSVNSFSGNIHGAGIAIVSARPVTIAKGTKLSTQSDLMASGHVGDDFFVPTGNIDIVTTSKKSNHGKVINAGTLLSDTGANILSGEHFENAGMIASHNSEISIKGTLKNTGYIEVAGNLEVGSKILDNRRALNATNLKVYAEDAIFNHLGGRILGNVVTLDTSYFINGSRQEVAPSIAKKSDLTIQSDLSDAADYGIYNSNGYSTPSSAVSELSAHISASELSINAAQVENINPYYRVRRSVEIWDDKVELNYAKSRRVSITAQNSINIYASKYLLNSSSILGLDNSGTFTINTPVMQNERYRVDTKGYIFARKEQNSTEEKHITHGTELETHIDALSPMAILYSFGRFDYSPLTSTSSTVFNNLMSFMQIHGRSNFYNTNFASIAIVASSETNAGTSVKCIVTGCGNENYQDNYTQTTFTSFLDDVDGLSSEILVETQVKVEDFLQKSIDDYIAAYTKKEQDAFVNAGNLLTTKFGKMFFYNTRVDKYDHGDILVITIYKCRLVLDGEDFYDKRCFPSDHSAGVTNIAAEAAKDGIVPGTEQTDAQIKEMIAIYQGNFNGAGSVQQRFYHNPSEPDLRTVNGYWGNSFPNSRYDIAQNSSGNIEITFRYYNRFFHDLARTQFVTDVVSYNPNQLHSKTVLYSTFKNAKPKTPVIRDIGYNQNTGAVTFSWSPVLVPNTTYEIDSSLGSATSTGLNRTFSKRSDGTIRYRVRACTQYNGNKYCGSYSANKTKTVDYVGGGNGGGGGGGPIEPPPCEGCSIHTLPIQSAASSGSNEQGGNLK